MGSLIDESDLTRLFPKWDERDRCIVHDLLATTRCSGLELNEANHYVICRNQKQPVAYLNPGYVEVFQPHDQLGLLDGLERLSRRVQENPVPMALSTYGSRTDGQESLRGKPCPSCTYERPLAGGCADDRSDCPFAQA